MFGGDEQFRNNNPKLYKLLKWVHHWELGCAIIVVAWFLPYPYKIFVLGWGLGTGVDDLLFESFSKYFNRKP